MGFLTLFLAIIGIFVLLTTIGVVVFFTLFHNRGPINHGGNNARFCTHCGTPNPNGQNFCGNCGAVLSPQQQNFYQ